ncbi:hypothetical protein CALVIDRAFT_539649 [Calocera viscosa TUFC12733]|uniref:Protein CPL1-like domain-containing protein n=1 Tax=Calocera viscosa (strain TUFC12733) TaxID=1330018 RepID=A0A167JN65_CALVF|nr:hypothetical protein CALVIDRAFT_539649 [Calocera viscosa TUFC12733]
MLLALLALSLPLFFHSLPPAVHAASLPGKRDVFACAFVDTELVVDGVDFGIFTECLCVDIIPDNEAPLAALIENNPVAKHAAEMTSMSQVTNALTDLVKNSGGASQCTYPPNANPVCTETDPCAYTCNAPYIKIGGKCVLPPPPSALGKRDIDICAFVDTELIVDGVDFGIFRECVCLDILDAVLHTNAVAKNAAEQTSSSQVRNAITDKINDSGGASQCIYPPHSNPVCTETDPCAYTCDPPYVKRGGKCVLLGSSGLRKRDLATCSYGLTRCGIWSRWGARSYECLDTAVELESCGGCAIPYADEPASGMDCSQIKGVADVQCQEGRCKVNRCRPGWVVGDDGASCVRLAPMSAGHMQTIGAAAEMDNIFSLDPHRMLGNMFQAAGY